MMILYGKEGLRNTLLYQNHARNSNLGSNLFITYIWLVKSLILSLKITIFEQIQLWLTISTWCYDLRQKCLQSQVTTKSWAIRWGMSELAIQTYTYTFWTKRGIFGQKNSILQGCFEFLDCQTSSIGLVMPKFEFLMKFCIETVPLMSL